MGHEDDLTTGQLRAIQDERATREAHEAHEASTDEEARAHERRADKAAYLRERLAEAERSEQQGGR